MKVRKRYLILIKNSAHLKNKLFFIAMRMKLSGWIISRSHNILEAELQGERKDINLYRTQIIWELGLPAGSVYCEDLELDEDQEGSLKIG